MMHKPKVLAMVRFKQREEQLLDSTKLQTFDPTQTDPEWRNGGKRRIPGSEAESGENMGTGSFLARKQISLMKGLGKREKCASMAGHWNLSSSQIHVGSGMFLVALDGIVLISAECW
jgi:hypothetical protein